MTTHTHKVINTYTSLAKQKQIDEHVNTIGKWINDVNGQNHDEALGFIYSTFQKTGNTLGNLRHSFLY